MSWKIAAISALTLVGCAGKEEPFGSAEMKQTVTIDPASAGYVMVVAPRADLPDWAPAPGYTYVYNDFGGTYHAFDYGNRVFHVVNEYGTAVDGSVGTALNLVAGEYRLVMNNTNMPLTVAKGATTTVYAGRIEVVGPSSDGYEVVTSDFRSVLPQNDYGRDSAPRGTGLNVLPGTYSVRGTSTAGVLPWQTVELQNSP